MKATAVVGGAHAAWVVPEGGGEARSYRYRYRSLPCYHDSGRVAACHSHAGRWTMRAEGTRDSVAPERLRRLVLVGDDTGHALAAGRRDGRSEHSGRPCPLVVAARRDATDLARPHLLLRPALSRSVRARRRRTTRRRRTKAARRATVADDATLPGRRCRRRRGPEWLAVGAERPGRTAADERRARTARALLGPSDALDLAPLALMSSQAPC